MKEWLNLQILVFLVDKDEVRSPKRACTERRNVLVDNNSFRSPVKDTLKSKLPPLQSAFLRFTSLPDSSLKSLAGCSIVFFFFACS